MRISKMTPFLLAMVICSSMQLFGRTTTDTYTVINNTGKFLILEYGEWAPMAGYSFSIKGFKGVKGAVIADYATAIPGEFKVLTRDSRSVVEYSVTYPDRNPDFNKKALLSIAVYTRPNPNDMGAQGDEAVIEVGSDGIEVRQYQNSKVATNPEFAVINKGAKTITINNVPGRINK